MTGFGAAARAKGSLELRAEARAVNHKYLQVKIRLPGELAFLESDVDERVRKRVDRGALTVGVVMAATSSLATMKVDIERARRYRRMLFELARELGIPGEVSLETLTALPGVLGGEVDDRSIQRARRLMLEVVDAALDAMTAMREAEGKALEADLRKNARALERVLARVDKRMPAVVRGHQETLRRRVEDLLGGRTQLQPQDLAREVALIADRMDVSEEVSRLKSHLTQLDKLLERAGPAGRQLDFLVQELLREANTIGSKCNDAEVAHQVVEMKTRIERLREQVQNVE